MPRKCLADMSRPFADFSHVKALRILNSELADTLGNLLSRACAKSLNPQHIYPVCHAEHLSTLLQELDAAKRLQETLLQLPGKLSSLSF